MGHRPSLKLYHILGLGTFAALDDFELYLLIFLQGAETLSLDVTMMHKDIGTISLGDKAVAFGITEPFNLTPYSHL
jgi:hypothetical protein